VYIGSAGTYVAIGEMGGVEYIGSLGSHLAFKNACHLRVILSVAESFDSLKK